MKTVRLSAIAAALLFLMSCDAFAAPPVQLNIRRVEATIAAAQNTANILGEEFGTTTGFVTFDQIPLTVTSWSNTRIGTTGPQGLQGPAGAPGATGAPGTPDISNYEIVSQFSTFNNATVIAGAEIGIGLACPAGKRVLGGGARYLPKAIPSAPLVLIESYPFTDNNWFVNFAAPAAGTTSGSIAAYAICATVQ